MTWIGLPTLTIFSVAPATIRRAEIQPLESRDAGEKQLSGFQRLRKTFTISVSSGFGQICNKSGRTLSPLSRQPLALPVRSQSPRTHRAVRQIPTRSARAGIFVVAPTDYMRLGTMQYPETLPLADKEVVLTFDDGPLPPHSNKILDILTSECVKATFFIIGRMARQFPDVVRREYAAGYTIGAHSQNHPLRIP